VQRHGKTHPVRGADQIRAVHLRDLLHHAIGGNGQVDRLAGGLTQLLQERLGDGDQAGLRAAAPGEADEHLTWQEPAVVVAPDQAVPLESEQQPARGGLRQAARRAELGERHRVHRVHNLRQQGSRPVNGLRAVLVALHWFP
jgi:hypothetical protein